VSQWQNEEDALDAIDVALAISPRAPGGHNTRGKAQAEMARRAAKQFPASSEILAKAAMLILFGLDGAGQSEAQEMCHRALSLSPTSSDAHYTLGFLCYINDDYTLAREHLHDSMRHGGGSDVLQLLADVIASLGDKEGALKLLSRSPYSDLSVVKEQIERLMSSQDWPSPS
jgi:hypothetical protein